MRKGLNSPQKYDMQAIKNEKMRAADMNKKYVVSLYRKGQHIIPRLMIIRRETGQTHRGRWKEEMWIFHKIQNYNFMNIAAEYMVESVSRTYGSD